MVCLICRQAELAKGLTSVTLEQDELKFVLKDVPALVCPACGESYLTEQVAARVLSQAEGLSSEGIAQVVQNYA